ncbi:MAG: hypothetical protein ABSE81_05320 [Candidatus Omnitrophota bacterium]|jgi:hypothetical protein
MMLNSLVIIFSLLFIVPVFAEQPKGTSIFGRTSTAVQEYEQGLTEKLPEMITRPNMVYDSSKRDPFTTAIIKKEKDMERVRSNDEDESAARSLVDSFSIQGIIWGGSFPQAIINNKVYKTGDSIQGLFISNIDKNGITFTSGGKKYILKMSAAVPAAKKR